MNNRSESVASYVEHLFVKIGTVTQSRLTIVNIWQTKSKYIKVIFGINKKLETTAIKCLIIYYSYLLIFCFVYKDQDVFKTKISHLKCF